VPDPSAFQSGRDFAAWLGLTPRQSSSGGKQTLGGITRQGNRYIRTLLVLGGASLLSVVGKRKGALRGVMDNVPVTAMTSLKSGPNLVVDLRPKEHCVFDVRYDSIPGPGELLARAINPWSGRTRLPACPGPAGVIMRSIFGAIHYRPDPHNPRELLLRPPAFKGSNFINWDRHADVLDASYQWALKEIERLRAEGDPAFEALLRCSDRIAGNGRR
jgi:hypothetical protein